HALSLHDALPICCVCSPANLTAPPPKGGGFLAHAAWPSGGRPGLTRSAPAASARSVKDRACVRDAGSPDGEPSVPVLLRRGPIPPPPKGGGLLGGIRRSSRCSPRTSRPRPPGPPPPSPALHFSQRRPCSVTMQHADTV